MHSVHYAPRRDDETQTSVNTHVALLSHFAKTGGFFDRLFETCPMRLISNNVPEMRDLVATVNGADGQHRMTAACSHDILTPAWKRLRVSAAGFSLASKLKSPLHPLFIGVRLISCPKSVAIEMGISRGDIQG